jgi:arginase family enzyme
MAEDLLYRMPRGLDREQLSRMQYSRRLRELLAAYGRRLAKLSRTYDLLLVVGGNHAAALPLYAVPGRVARFDAHTDADENPLLRNTSYVYHAVKEGGLKKPGLVTHYSAEHYSVKRPQEPRINLGSPEQALSAEAHVVDIDVDALHRKYETATYETDAMLVSQFGPVVMRSAPKIVGVFEYYPHADKHGVGMRFIKAIALQALKVRARKLAGK